VRAAVLCAAALLAGGCTAGPIDVAHLNPDLFGQDLIAHWTFDAGSGTVLRDDTGHNHDGTITGAAWIPAGQFGGAMQFMQPGSEVSVAAFPNATPSWTVSLWANVSAAQLPPPNPPPVPDYVTLVSTEVPVATGTTAGGWEANVNRTPDGKMLLHFGYWVGPNVNDYAYAECDCLQTGRWTHFAAAVDGEARTLAIYVDGEQRKLIDVRALILPGSATLYMARWSFDSTSRLYVGGLDDVAIFGRSLASEEIRRLTAAPAPSPLR
jgi:hypothetical protein